MSLSLLYSYFLGIKAFTPGGWGSRAEEDDVAEGVELIELGQLVKLVRLKRPLHGCMRCGSAWGKTGGAASRLSGSASSTAFCVVAHTQCEIFRERSAKSLHAPLRSPDKFTSLPN